MDTVSVEQRSRNMARIRGVDTGPELAVRRIIRGLGFRPTLHQIDLPGKPDLVFRRRKKAIFVHGCFWHQHPKATCRASRLPKSRLHYWKPKLARTVIRDAEHRTRLRRAGWQSLVIWECELQDLARLQRRITRFFAS